MATHLSRIATLERALAKLTDERATHAEVDSLRAEYRKLLEAEHLDVLNLKAHVWAVGESLRLVPCCCFAPPLRQSSSGL